jgi:hypothetical protein
MSVIVARAHGHPDPVDQTLPKARIGRGGKRGAGDCEFDNKLIGRRRIWL